MATPDEPYTELLSLAVHEFRTPAGIVGGYLRMLQRDADAPLSDRQKKMVLEAERSCQRLVALIAELSEIQHLDAERLTPVQQPLDLFALIEEVAAGTDEAADRGVRLQLRGPSAGAAVNGDVPRLQRAFSALFRAILREMPADTTVVGERRLITRDGGRSAMLVIAEQSQVPSSFDAAPVRFDEKRGGLGLALPIARRVIQRHGGRVWSPAGDGGRSAAVISIPVLEPSR